MHKKSIVATVDNFSGYLSTAFANSETGRDLLDALITTTFPFKSSTLTNIRVDQAPGFRKLMKSEENLKELGIHVEPGEAKNKNALAIVDRKIRELHDEIKKLTPQNVVNVSILAQATNAVNEKIRNQGFSSKEILFSRDQFSNELIPIKDNVFAEEVMKTRERNNH